MLNSAADHRINPTHLDTLEYDAICTGRKDNGVMSDE
jgi:hypothetical protein